MYGILLYMATDCHLTERKPLHRWVNHFEDKYSKGHLIYCKHLLWCNGVKAKAQTQFCQHPAQQNLPINHTTFQLLNNRHASVHYNTSKKTRTISDTNINHLFSTSLIIQSCDWNCWVVVNSSTELPPPSNSLNLLHHTTDCMGFRFCSSGSITSCIKIKEQLLWCHSFPTSKYCLSGEVSMLLGLFQIGK